MKYQKISLLIYLMIFSYLVAFGGYAYTLNNNQFQYNDRIYKDIVTIHEKSSVDLVNYQVLIELDSSNFDFSKSNIDGSDIRFALNDYELNYWIEEWDTTANRGNIWVKVPFIQANSKIDLEMYYGNPSSIVMSDGCEVFDLFDDFDGNVLDENTWEYNRRKGEVKLHEGYAELKMYPETDDNFAAELISKKRFEGNFSIHVTACARYNTETDIGVLFNYNPNGLLGYMVSTDVPSDELYGPISISINQNLRIAQGSKRLSVYPNWNTIYIKRIGSEIIAEYDGEVISAIDTTYKSGKIALLDDAQSGSSLLVDRILVRQYTYPEPAIVLHSDELPEDQQGWPVDETPETIDSARVNDYIIEIIDKHGNPIEMARVDIGGVIGYTREDGKVELELLSGDHLVVLKPLGDCGDLSKWHNFGDDLDVVFQINSYPTTIELFDESYYSGASKEFDVHGNLDKFNNRASSAKVPDGWKLILYDHSDYKGESRLITQDTPDLGDFSKRASSFKLVRSDAPIVTLYQDAHYAGKSKHITEDTPSLVDDSLFGYPIGDFNDGVSSIKVPEGYQVILYADVDYTGAPRLLTEDTPELGDFNDIMSSLKLLKLGDPVEFLSGDNTISVELSSAEGSKDTGRINTGKVTFYPKDSGGYGVKIDFVDFEGRWCSSDFINNDDYQYLIELWKETNLLGFSANQKNNTWSQLKVEGGHCGRMADLFARWVTCQDLEDYDPGFSITEPGNYFVQVKVVHKHPILDKISDPTKIIKYEIEFETVWAKTEYIWYNFA